MGSVNLDPWTAAMRRGDFAAAWRVSDAALHAARPDPSETPRHLQAVWRGDPLAGQRVLVRCYHGLGDTLQFIRYAELVRAIAREVIVWAQPELIPLLRNVRGIDRLLPLHNGTPEADYDVDLEVMELAHVLRTEPGSMPSAAPYLHVAAAPLPEPDAMLKVGLVWEAGGWDPRRSVLVTELAALTDVPGLALYALQRGPGLRDWVGLSAGSDRPEETAAAMQALDLVITIDSFPAHLAGALGRPTWTLLHADPDWRWMVDRDDSPWYPTMRLFRQEQPGDWAPVIARVAAELRLHLQQRRAVR